MNNSINKKNILIFDGISGAVIGRELTETFLFLGYNVLYIDNKILKQKKFYKIRASISKIIHKFVFKKKFYYYPKLDQQYALKVIKKQLPDIVLVIGFIYKFIDPKLLIKLKEKLNFKFMLWDTDSCNLFQKQREFDYFVHTEFPVYDKIYSFSQKITNFINEIKIGNAAFLPFGAKPIPEIKNKFSKFDICFVGSADLRRIFCLEKLKKYNLIIYGSKWNRNKQLMTDELKNKIIFNSIWGKKLHLLLNQSKIILNITRSTFYGIETGLNLRIFETLAAKSFLLTDYSNELDDLFIIGEEIETYQSTEELVDKIDYYLAHDVERNKIARKGYERYLKEYTWEARINKMKCLGFFK